MAVLCWFGCTWEAEGNCKSFCERGPWDRPPPSPSRTQSTSLGTSYVERNISAANAEMEALLNRNNASGSRENPQTTVNDWPVPNRYTAVRPSAPPTSPSDPSAPPPSYHQLLASDPQVREQRIITHFENRGYSNTARVLADIFNRTAPQPSNQNSESPTSVIVETHYLPGPHAPITRMRPRIESNTRRGLIADSTQRSWGSYFNTADRLRDLTSDSRTRDTLNETDIPTTRHQPRSQTPPPMYHEIEQTAVQIARSESLPSYDDFIAYPHKYMT